MKMSRMCEVFVTTLVAGWLYSGCLAQAQNPQCPTRPLGDSSNACASTSFVQTAIPGAFSAGANILLTGSSPTVISTVMNPVFTTSVQTPIVIGNTTASGSLTLLSTSAAAAGSNTDKIVIQTSNGITPTIDTIGTSPWAKFPGLTQFDTYGRLFITYGAPSTSLFSSTYSCFNPNTVEHQGSVPTEVAYNLVICNSWPNTGVAKFSNGVAIVGYSGANNLTVTLVATNTAIAATSAAIGVNGNSIVKNAGGSGAGGEFSGQCDTGGTNCSSLFAVISDFSGDAVGSYGKGYFNVRCFTQGCPQYGFSIGEGTATPPLQLTGSAWMTDVNCTGCRSDYVFDFNNWTANTFFIRGPGAAFTITGAGATAALTYNKVTITTPATGSTLTIINGKTFTVNKTLTLDGTDGTTQTFPTTSATIARTDAGQTFTGAQIFSTPIGPASGGTGIANNAASTITISGSFSLTFTITGITSVTLPVTGTLATLAGSEELTNKTLNASIAKGTWTASGTWILPDHTLGGTISGGGNQINNVIIGTTTPLAGTFTTLTATTLIVAPVGSVSAPGISFTGDSNTGLYWISADKFALAANGAAVVTIATIGIGIGPTATTPTASIDLVGATNNANAMRHKNTNDAAAWLNYADNTGNFHIDQEGVVNVITLSKTSGNANFGSATAGTSKTVAAITGASLGVTGAIFSDTLSVITMANTATTSAVCYNTATGLFTYNSTVGTCTVSMLAAKNLQDRLSPREGLEIVLAQQPWKYTMKQGLPTYVPGPQIGFVADYVKDRRLLALNDNGSVGGFRYEQFTAALAGAVQQLNADNDNIRHRINKLERRRILK